jgi:predicted nucleotidyltransferase
VSESADTVFRPRAILKALLDHGVDFVVVGGVAVQVHGHVRGTRDLDIAPAPDLLNLSRLGEALAALGAPPGDPHQTRRSAHVRRATDHGLLDLLNVDLLDRVRMSYDQLRDRAVEVELDGRTLLVAGLDDVIRMKRVAGREVDLSDIGALTRTDEELREEAGEST